MRSLTLCASLASLCMAAGAACSRSELDAPKDAGADVILDAHHDALAPIDGSIADVNVSLCGDGGVTGGILITEDDVLLRFDPSTGFQSIGVVTCPAPSTQAPESMAVARDGTAFVYFATTVISTHPPATSMYHVDPTTLVCTPTAFVGPGDDRVGMAFTTNGLGPTETLFLLTAVDQGLYSVSSTYARTLIAPLAISFGELAGGGDGRLFSLYTPDDDPGARLVELDKTTGNAIASDPLYDLQIGQSLAFFRLGNAFFIFTDSGQDSTTVSKYDPSAKTLEQHLFTWSTRVVGAGSSTCASL